MNRRDFLRLSLLVIPALSLNLQLEPEKFEIISPSETFNKAFEKMPEAFLEGYKMGQRTIEGYVEGVQGHNQSVPWSSENCDPIADLEAVRDWMLDTRV